MDAAEHLSLSHRPEIFERGSRLVVDYYNAKRLNSYHKTGPTAGELLDNYKELMLTNSRHFGDVGINVSVSAVHVPTNVYDGGTFLPSSLLSILRGATGLAFTINEVVTGNYRVNPHR